MSKSSVIKRSAGILMPVTSLPSDYGIGTLGEEAYKFIDFLERANHSYWQVLPLLPTGYGDSPYQSCSVFAGNPYLIDFQMLIQDGLLLEEEIGIPKNENSQAVNYSEIFSSKIPILKKAYQTFLRISDENEKKEYNNYLLENADWLESYSLYMACKEKFAYAEWSGWEEEIRNRTEEGLSQYTKLFKKEIDFWSFSQYEFDKQWSRLKTYANERGIQIIGDIPIYTAYDSADVWTDVDMFELDQKRFPICVAAVPPDAFSQNGQKWGNPLYNWKAMEENNFSWWERRMKRSAKLYDVIRLDHFIGMVQYYSVPAKMADARNGIYRMGPGEKLLRVINEAVGKEKIIAENLGVSIPKADELLHLMQYPVMQVIEFAFDGNKNNPHLPYNYERNSVVYGGTHDNETLYGYFMDRGEEELSFAYEFLGTKNKMEMVDNVFRVAYGSVASLVIFQIQDVLKLDNRARMNSPSTLGSNWTWRLQKNQLTDLHLQYLKSLSNVYGRI